MLDDELLSPSRVFVDLAAQPKGGLLREMTRRLAAEGSIADAEAVAKLLIKREEMITTAVKPGCAFPHAFSPEVKSLILAIGAIAGGTDYQSLDGSPVEFIFLVLGPPSHQDVHLRLLARLSRMTSEPGMIEAMREAKSPEELAQVITDADRQAAARR